MKSLLEKFEALLDEATLLVREERARRNASPWPGFPWDITCRPPDFYGPRGTEFRCGPDHPAAQGGFVVPGSPGGT